MRALAHCPVDPTPVVEEQVDLVELRFRYGDAVVRRARAPVICMTQRRRLDAFLLDAARERGVEVREGERSIDGNASTARPADVVVGADGANGTTAKAFGLGGGIVHGVAYEGNVAYGVARPRALRAPRGRRARRHSRRLRLGVPEGRPRERRRRRVAGRRAAASASTSRASARRTTSTRRSSRACAATACRCAGRRDAARRRARAARRRRGGADRPGLGRRDVRVLRLVAARGGGDPRPARGPRDDARAVRRRGRRGAGAAAPRLVEAEAGARPLAARTSWRVARTQLLWRSVERLLLGDVAAPADVHGVARVPLRVLDTLARF